MKKLWLLCALAPLLSACGPSVADLAAAACEREIIEKVTGKSYDLDLGEMRAMYKSTEPNIGTITSRVMFDRGLPSENAQAFTCRVQFDPKSPGAEPAVIGLTFVW
jgi:hypothetical protein